MGEGSQNQRTLSVMIWMWAHIDQAMEMKLHMWYKPQAVFLWTTNVISLSQKAFHLRTGDKNI